MKQYYLLFTAILFLGVAAFSQSGSLDYSFGDSGIVYNPINSTANASALQSDGKILYGGDGYYVARHNTDGSLDSSFGTNGIAQPGFPLTILAGIKVLDDGRILTGGNAAYGDVAAALFRPNGTLDSSFGTNGYSTADFGESEFINAMSIQTDGKILLAGYKNEIGVSIYMLTVRLNKDGSVDKSFGNNGEVVNTSGYAVNSLDIQPDGKIITAGYLSNGGLFEDFVINRYNDDGSLDQTFGTEGKVLTSFGDGENIPYSIKILPDGKFLVAGEWSPYITGQPFYMVVAKYNTDGSLDNTFGTEGKAIIGSDKGFGLATNLLLQKDGKIILTGYTSYYGGINSDIVLAKLNTNGTLDSSFGLNGLQTSDFGSNNEASKTSLLQDDNKIIIVGEEHDTWRVFLARYNNDVSGRQKIIARIKRWLHRHGFTWDDCPKAICNNIAGYAVQRSSNGVNWVTIFRSRNIANRNYEDAAPLSGTNYYRLQITSVDGAVAYSNVVAVADNNIAISPNPAQNNLRIEGLTGNVKLTVVNFTGNVAISQQLPANSSSSYNLNITQLKAGNYLLKIEMKDEVVTKKFVKE